jgi:hypothetical protein
MAQRNKNFCAAFFKKRLLPSLNRKTPAHDASGVFSKPWGGSSGEIRQAIT